MTRNVVFVWSEDFPSGKFVPSDKPTISVYEHGFLYGDGAFEGIRVYGGCAFKLREHIKRLYDSMRYLGIKIPFKPKNMERKIVETVRRNKVIDGYIRPVVSRGIGDLGINPKKCRQPTIVIIADTIKFYPKEAYENGLCVITSLVPRTPKRCIDPNAKLTQYANNIRASLEANRSVANEAIMLDEDGFVSECTGDNIFMVHGNALFTPKTKNILVGITRNTIIGIAKSLHIRVHERDLRINDFYKADEVFVTGTAAEVCPVRTIDGKVIGNGKPGPVTMLLTEKFREVTKNPKYLTCV